MAGPQIAVFSGAGQSGAGLWVTDGTVFGTHQLDVAVSDPGDFAYQDGFILFSGGDASNKSGLWVTDGTAAGTYELTGIANAATSGGGLSPTDITAFPAAFGDVFVFEGVDSGGLKGLWVSNGTAQYTHEVTGIDGASSTSFNPTDFTVFDGEVLFRATDDANATGLWVTQGGQYDTHQITGILGASASGLSPSDMTVFNSKVLFNGVDTNNLSGLWITDGSAVGTVELTGIPNASVGANLTVGPAGLDPTDITVFGNGLLFNGEDTAGLAGLWVSNGTAGGTHELTGIVGASAGVNPNHTYGLDPTDFTVFNNEVLFTGFDANGVLGLWVTDGTAGGTHELTGIAGASTTVAVQSGDAPFQAGLEPASLAVVNGEVVFSGIDSTGARGLWVTDGTAPGTHELGIAGAAPQGLSPSGFLTLPPAVDAIFETLSPENLPPTPGQPVTIGLGFNEHVTVTGEPTLLLANGHIATYAGGSGTNGLLFYTTAGPEDTVAKLAPLAVDLNGGSIQDSNGVATNLLLSGIGVTPEISVQNPTPGAQISGYGMAFVGAGNIEWGGGPPNGDLEIHTAVFTGSVEQYAVTGTYGGDIVITDAAPYRDGVTTLENVEQAQFSDITLVFDRTSGEDKLVYELYQAAYGRTPDLTGFRYWAGVADSTQASALSLADAFLAAPEFTRKYGADPTNLQYVTELYTNVLERAPDQAGLDYWVGKANAGEARDQLLVDFATSAENVALVGAHTSEGFWVTH